MKTYAPMAGQLSLFDFVIPVSIPDNNMSNKTNVTAKEVTTISVPKKTKNKTKKKLTPMQKFISENNGIVIEDCINFTGDDFKAFCRKLKSALNKEAKEKGCDYVTLHPNHYDMSGFFKKGEKYVYWSYSVVRGDQPTYLDKDGLDGVLYRTAKSEKDYTGGHNNFCKLGDLIENALTML